MNSTKIVELINFLRVKVYSGSLDINEIDKELELISKLILHQEKLDIVFFYLKNGKYLTKSSEEIKSEMLVKSPHKIIGDSGYLIVRNNE